VNDASLVSGASLVTDGPLAADSPPESDAPLAADARLVTKGTEQKRRIRNTTFAVAALAVGFYLAFIVMAIYRSRH